VTKIHLWCPDTCRPRDLDRMDPHPPLLPKAMQPERNTPLLPLECMDRHHLGLPESPFNQHTGRSSLKRCTTRYLCNFANVITHATLTTPRVITLANVHAHNCSSTSTPLLMSTHTTVATHQTPCLFPPIPKPSTRHCSHACI